MGIRKTTIKDKISKALEQLEKNRIESAKKTLEALEARIEDGGAATKRKPGKYALFIKSQYPKMKKQFPNLDAPGILKKIAAKWKKTDSK